LLTKLKVFTLLLLLIICCTGIYSQQLPIFTQYSEYGGLINPSYIPFSQYHTEHKTALGAAYRDQWTQLPDRPRTLAVRFESSTNYSRGVNLIYGGYILKDQIGVFQTTEVQARVGGFFRTTNERNKKSGISIGLNFGAGQYRADLADLAYVDLDPILFKENAAVIYPDVGVGVSFLNEFDNNDYLQLGLSVPQMFGLDHTYTNERKEFDIRRVPHYYLTSSYYKILSDDTYLEFSGWAKYVKELGINYDLLIRYKFSENMWIGFGGNSSYIIHTEAGAIIQYGSDSEVRIGYSYNPTFYSHSVIFGNIHELSLAYSFR